MKTLQQHNMVNIPQDKIMLALLDHNYEVNGSYPAEYSNEYARIKFVFDTPEEFIKKWYELDEGAWYWVFVNGRCICSGAANPDDIEVFENYFSMSFEEVE